MAQEEGALTGHPPPGRFGLLEGPQPFVLLPQPAHQVGVDAFEKRIQGGAVESPVVLHPPAHDRIDRPLE